MTTDPTPLALLVPFALLVFYAYCLADFSRTPEREMRRFDRRGWVLILVFANVAGGLLWLCVGRPNPPRGH